MAIPEVFGTSSASLLPGLTPSSLDSITDLTTTGLLQPLNSTGATDPFAAELNRLTTLDTTLGNTTNPRSVAVSASNNLLLPVPLGSSTDRDPLLGLASNTPLVGSTGIDSLINSANRTATSVTPRITAALVNDTAAFGGTNTDDITSDPSIAGSITGNISSFKAGFDNTPTNQFLQVLPDINSDGSFSFSRTRLEQILGGVLPQGAHTLHLSATEAGSTNELLFNLSFTFDNLAASVPTNLDLLTFSDSGTSNTDNLTNNTTPTIAGNAESGTLVQLFRNGQQIGQTTTLATNTWQIATSGLAQGVHALTAKTVDGAGNVSTASPALELTIDTTPSVVIAALASDTAPGGGTNNDGITANATITGTVTAGSSLSAGFNDALSSYVDVTANLSIDGSFTFSRTQLVVCQL